MIRTATQLKAKVRNLSGGDSKKAQTLIRNFIMERFLERIAVNWCVKYKKRKRRTLRNPYCPLRARKWLEMGLFQR